MSLQYLKYLFSAFVILVLHIIVVPLIAIERITPDLMLILVVYIALKNGQIAGTVAGFIGGLMIDIAGDFALGFSALSKTVCGFIAGYFYNEVKIDINTETLRFAWIVLLCSAINNAIYFLIDFIGKDMATLEILKLMFGGAIYTAILSLIPVLITSRKASVI